ncbi:PorP/SprF family type IX secretion system membrane protein [Ascidiimonas sp. W6]|uniref:PorP/SprF family type IX secretion system membrane protein n=1 Tax=Ascidiimonas meishanensis TaxID=3128903 RepID=UPI0030EF10BD
MNYSIKRFLTVVLVFISLTIQAQQHPDYVFYRYNLNAFNPAAAGYEGITSFTLNIRSQWQGIDEAPRTQTFLVSSALSDRVGLGISIINDQTFIEKQTAFYVDFSYKLQIADETNLFLGIKAGGNVLDVNAGGLQTFNYTADPLLIDQSNFNPNIGVGVLLKNEDYFVSLSSPGILNTKRFDEIDGEVIEATDELHVYLAGGYTIAIAQDWLFKPSVLTRMVSGAPLSATITAAVEFREKFEFGVAYRTDSGVSGLALIRATDWLQAGYAYDSSLRSQLNDLGSGTHELMLRFFLPVKSENKEY